MSFPISQCLAVFTVAVSCNSWLPAAYISPENLVIFLFTGKNFLGQNIKVEFAEKRVPKGGFGRGSGRGTESSSRTYLDVTMTYLNFEFSELLEFT